MELELDPLLEKCWDDAFTWTKELLRERGKPYGTLDQIASVREMNKLTQPAISNIAARALNFVEDLMNYAKELKTVNSSLKCKLISCQEENISLRKELAECKAEQIDVLKTTVTDSVRAEFKSYSSVVQQSPPNEPTMSSSTLQSVVKRVVEEEDRSRNLVIFGLAEADGEKITAKVGEVFEALGEKPSVDAYRIGKKKSCSEKACRPVFCKGDGIKFIDGGSDTFKRSKTAAIRKI